MNIVIIPSWYETKDNSQSGIFFKQQAAALAQAGNQVVVLNATPLRYSKWLSGDCFRLKIYYDGPLKIYTYCFPLIKAELLPQIYYLLTYFCLNRIFNKMVNDGFIPDVIHAHSNYMAGYVSTKIALKHDIPLYVTEHYSIYLKKWLPLTHLKQLKETVAKSKAFICVSEALKNSIIEKVGESSKIIVIPNMIASLFTFSKRKTKPYFLFFSAGNLCNDKQFEILIRAFARTFRGKISIKLAIAGDGVLKEKLKLLIAEYGVSQQVSLLGRLSPEQIKKNLDESDAFVLLSKHETFGIVYREAMAVGRPVISSDNGGIMDGWNDSFGKIVYDCNEQNAGDAMKYVFENIDKYDCNMISKACIESFSQKTVIKQLMNIYTRSV